MSRVEPQYSGKGENFVLGLWGVRYQVVDAGRAVAFYTERLGFKLDQQNLPAFAQVSVGHLTLIMSGLGASGSRPMPDLPNQDRGGRNRAVLQLQHLHARREALGEVGVRFRIKLEVGPGGRRLQIELHK